MRQKSCTVQQDLKINHPKAFSYRYSNNTIQTQRINYATHSMQTADMQDNLMSWLFVANLLRWHMLKNKKRSCCYDGRPYCPSRKTKKPS